MYCVYGESRSSLLIESTDSIIKLSLECLCEGAADKSEAFTNFGSKGMAVGKRYRNFNECFIY